MRIIAGQLKGRPIHELHGAKTHPMSEKLRGAVFNALGDIEGLSVLDAFAGTGSVGYEAISRGAERATMVDNDAKAITSMKKTRDELALEATVDVIQQSVDAWSTAHPDVYFDIVVMDPPHDNIDEGLILTGARHSTLGGIVVVCLPSNHQNIELDGFETIRQKTYGNAQLVFYRHLK